MTIIFWLLASLFVALFGTEPAFADKRVALVIGNGSYKSQGVLDNPTNDARLIAETLKKAAFETIETQLDVGITQFRQALRRFQSQADGAEVALVYFAGHGIEANGANWLLPTDAELAEDRDLEYEAIKSDLMLQALRGARMRVLVLDACRNNPFGRSWRRGARNASSGLAKLEADDVLVLFAAAPGQTASDGTGGNSPFAVALAKYLAEPGLAIQFLGGKVRDDVLAATGGVQRPYVSASITGRAFFLIPGEAEKKKSDAAKALNAQEKRYFDRCVTLSPHLSRETMVERLASRFKAGSHTYGWRYDPPAPNLSEGDYPIASAEIFPDGVLLINYNYRWGRLFLVPVTLAKADEPRGSTRGFTRRDTQVEGASIQMHGMWIQESGYGCANFFVNGETGEAAGTWTVTDDAGKPLKSTHRIKKVEAR
jgi:hypothetical protein